MSRVHDALRRAEQAGNPQAASQNPPSAPPAGAGRPAPTPATHALVLEDVPEVSFSPAHEALLIDASRPQDSPSEEFRSLRTRLNHLQSLQPIHTVVVTSPSPAESQMKGNLTLLCDFDFRRPAMHNLFQIERSPGATDYLLGQAPLAACMKRVEGSSLYLMPAGSAVKNPLELLNLKEAK